MTLLPGRRFVWAVLGGVLAALLLGAAGPLLGIGYAALTTAPVRAAEDPPPAVVVVGTPGLSWDDVDPEGTPTVAGWAAKGLSGSLVPRGAHLLTCAADGWLTLGAGQRAAADLPGHDAATGCGPQQVEPVAVEGQRSAVTLPGWEEWVQAAADRPLDARLGSLAEGLAAAGECAAAYGPLAALGAAGPDGVAEHYVPTPLPEWDGTLAGDCRVHLVDATSASGPAEPVVGEGLAPATLDTELARVAGGWPEGTVVLVAGLADRGGVPALRALLLAGDVAAGPVLSPTTRQVGLAQTADVTATVLEVAGAERPPAVAGRPLRSATAGADDPPPQDAQQVVRSSRDLAAAATLAQAVAGPFLVGAAALALLLLAVTSRLSRTAVAVVATGGQAVPAGAFLAGLLPWWRAGGPDGSGTTPAALLALSAAVLLAVLVIVAAAWGGPWRRTVLGPPTVVAAATVAVVAVDVMWGGRLGLVSVIGVQPVVGARFYGMGNVAFGIISASVLLLGGVLAAVVRGVRPGRRETRLAGAVVLALGAAVALVDGLPQWGADFGGVAPMLVSTGVLALSAAGLRLTALRALLLGAAALGVAAGIMAVDWLRPPAERTHLGAFAQAVVDGQALGIVGRKLEQSLGILVRYPASWIAVVLLALVVWALVAPASRPGRLLAPLWRVPLLHAVAVALVTCWVLGWAINDSGIAIVGMGLAVAVAALVAVGARLPLAPRPPGTAPEQREGDVAQLPRPV